jgi:hypothetical protein
MYSKNLVHFILYSKHTKCRVNLDFLGREGRTDSYLSFDRALHAIPQLWTREVASWSLHSDLEHPQECLDLRVSLV